MTDTTSEIKLDFVTIRKLDDGLMENIFHSGAHIDVPELLQIKEINESFCLPERYVVLAVSGDFTTITKEAREHLAGKEFAKNTRAKAILVKYLGQKIMGNFYLNVNKPFMKTKIFTDRSKAIEWLYLQLKHST